MAAKKDKDTEETKDTATATPPAAPAKRQLRVEDVVTPMDYTFEMLMNSTATQNLMKAFAASHKCPSCKKEMKYVPSGAVENIQVIGGVFCENILTVTDMQLKHHVWLIPWTAVTEALKFEKPEDQMKKLYELRDDATKRYNEHLAANS